MQKVLFADDHIPDDDIQSDQIEAHYRAMLEQRFADHPAEFRERALANYRVMRETLAELRLDRFEVRPANTLARALELARSERFDIAILDLGWFMERDLSEQDRELGGWRIAEELAKADARSGHVTRQILHSSRLNDRPDVVPTAVKYGQLPVLKHTGSDRKLTPEQVARESLRAALKYVQAQIEQVPEEERRARAAVLTSFRRWDALSQAAIGVGVLLWVFAAASAIRGEVATTAVAGILGAATTILGYLGRQAKQARDDFNKLWQQR